MTDKKVVYKMNGPDGNWVVGSYAIECPACNCLHVFDKRWTFNGDYVKPTFRASMLVHENKDYRKRSNDKHGHRCHSFVTDGKIKFLGDCTHSMKNQEVALKPF